MIPAQSTTQHSVTDSLEHTKLELLRLLSSMQTILHEDPAWSNHTQHLGRNILAFQHELSKTDIENIPLNLLQTMKRDIDDLKTTVEAFPEPTIKAKAVNIVNQMEHMNGQLSVGRSFSGNTPYMEALYQPLDVRAVFSDLNSLFELSFGLALQPQLELHAKIDTQIQKIDALINDSREERELRKKELKAKEDELAVLRERSRKAEQMNAVYDFVSKCERLYCQVRNVQQQTFVKGVQSATFNLEELREAFELGTLSGQILLDTVKQVKEERLEYGHASLGLRKSLRLRDAFIPLVEEHFGLTVRQKTVMGKLRDWVVGQLGEDATLHDLFESA
ncbi:hypothetical protein HK097_003588 [Rhizophlyctis rosea]|uniref:Uncharacterized protein n=1 Tax=Rhizophlyctis rosea TaxID=64517 RepID=A0AAD5WZZ3_9FUNG|nr:hypothetical protein HK097_003588 [Rhizophlyctis rosea]